LQKTAFFFQKHRWPSVFESFTAVWGYFGLLWLQNMEFQGTKIEFFFLKHTFFWFLRRKNGADARLSAIKTCKQALKVSIRLLIHLF